MVPTPSPPPLSNPGSRSAGPGGLQWETLGPPVALVERVRGSPRPLVRARQVFTTQGHHAEGGKGGGLKSSPDRCALAGRKRPHPAWTTAMTSQQSPTSSRALPGAARSILFSLQLPKRIMLYHSLSLSGLSRPPQLLTAPLTHQAGSQLRASHLRFPLPGGPSPEVPVAPSLLPELRYCPPTLFKAAALNFPPTSHSLPCFVLFHCVYHHLTSSVFCLLVH